ncbi:MAG TPA: phosphoribosylanthranilate isomerase [Solirubrobacterales bacterium]|nr:phosphoribosylanthranilate isomerase [Solirubrobacterales bacterium]
MRVKICGITNLADAEVAVEHGAWAIGLIHHPASPRACEPAAAAEISARLRRRCELVGVFVNPSLGQVARAVEDASLSMVQLSGEEGPSFCTEVARKTGAKVIKAVHVSSAAEIHGAEAYRTDFHLFDRRSGELRGGTGKSFDWGLLAARESQVPAILAGGLTPDNVAEAIVTARPYAVDVASGVEASPGHKDHGRVASFIFEAMRAGAPVAEDALPAQ